MVANNSTNRVAGYVNECATESKHLVEHYPAASVAISFGLGMLTGLALLSLMSEDPSRRVSHRLGAQILESLHKVLPDSVMHPFRG